MNLDAQALLTEYDDFDIAPYAISISRDWSLCNAMQTFTIVLDPSVIQALPLGVELKPSVKCHVYEHGIRVIVGTINTVKFMRKPEPLIEITGSDNYKFAKDYFIDQELGVSNGETVAYWIGELMNLVGLNYNIISPEPATMTVAPGIEFNLRSVDDAMVEILSYSSSYVYTGRNGTVNISNAAIDSTLAFESGPTTVYDDNDPTNIVGGNVTRASHQRNDNNTRNVIKVWGWKANDPFYHADQSPYIQSIAYGNVDLPVPKTILYSSSLIQTQSAADMLAERIAAEVGKFDSIKTVECIGNPDITIAKKASLDIDLESSHLTGSAKITTIHSSMSKDGYIMEVKMDEFCPKFAAWEIVQPPEIFYAGTSRNGVYKSTDAGSNWVAYNNGLVTGAKYVKSLAATEDDEVMAIINGQLWYTTSSGMTISNPQWRRKYLPAPINTAGDNPAPTSPGGLVTVASSGTTGQFDVLTTITSGIVIASGVGLYIPYESVYRSWVYSTTNAGQNWTSVQLQSVNEQSQSLFSFGGTHLSNRYTIPYAAANHGAEHWDGMWIYKFPMTRTAYWIDYTDTPYEAVRVGLPDRGFDLGFTYWDFVRDPVTYKPVVNLTGTPGNRQLQFTLLFPKTYNLRNTNYYAGEPPILMNSYVQPLGFRYRVYPGDIIIDDYQPIPAYETYGVWVSPGLTVTEQIPPPQYAGYYHVLAINAYESILGSNAFWMKFSIESSYFIRRFAVTWAEWRVYSGEPYIRDRNGVDYASDTYPWEYWPLGSWSERPNDEYPLYLGAGRIRFNFDEIEYGLL